MTSAAFPVVEIGMLIAGGRECAYQPISAVSTFAKLGNLPRAISAGVPKAREGSSTTTTLGLLKKAGEATLNVMMETGLAGAFGPRFDPAALIVFSAPIGDCSPRAAAPGGKQCSVPRPVTLITNLSALSDVADKPDEPPREASKDVSSYTRRLPKGGHSWR